jgi:hypothetical protein
MKKQSYKKSWVLLAVLAVAVAAAIAVWQITRDSDAGKKTESNSSQADCRTIQERRVCPSAFIGLTEADALAKAEADGLSARVVERDGEGLPVDLSLQPDRLNFSVTDDKVTKVEFY